MVACRLLRETGGWRSGLGLRTWCFGGFFGFRVQGLGSGLQDRCNSLTNFSHFSFVVPVDMRQPDAPKVGTCGLWLLLVTKFSIPASPCHIFEEALDSAKAITHTLSPESMRSVRSRQMPGIGRRSHHRAARASRKEA